MTYRGRVENGVIVLDEPAELPEGMKVLIAPSEPPAATNERKKPSPLMKYAGKAVGFPPDASERVDDYLYGPGRP